MERYSTNIIYEIVADTVRVEHVTCRSEREAIDAGQAELDINPKARAFEVEQIPETAFFEHGPVIYRETTWRKAQ
jgi:hypothetical protein